MRATDRSAGLQLHHVENMVRSRQLLINIAAAAIPTLIVLLTIPAYVRVIGPDKYGVLAIVWVLFGYAGIFDLGLSPSVNNAISKTAEGDFAGKAQIVWSAAAVAMLIGITVSVLAALSFRLWHFIISPEILSQIAPAIPVLIAGLPLLTVTSILNGSLEGAQRFDIAGGLQVTAAALYQVGPLSAAYLLGTNLSTLIIVVVGCRALVLVLYVIANAFQFRIFSHLSASVDRVRQLVRFGYGIALVNILDPLLNRTDQFSVAYLTGPAGVAAYNIAVSAVSRMTIIPMALARTMFPVLSAGKLEEYRADLIGTERRVLLIWFGVSALAILACGLAFGLWLGHGVGSGVAMVARVLLAGLFLNSLAYLPYVALQADGKGVRVMRAHLIELPIFLLVLVALAVQFGAVGAAVAWSTRAALDFFILWRMAGRQARSMAGAAAMFLTLLVLGLLLHDWGA